MRSLQGVQFCKRIKFAGGYKAGRWERVEESLDSVITNGAVWGVAREESRALWKVPWLSAEDFWDRTAQRQLSDLGDILYDSGHHVKWAPPCSKG